MSVLNFMAFVCSFRIHRRIRKNCGLPAIKSDTVYRSYHACQLFNGRFQIRGLVSTAMKRSPFKTGRRLKWTPFTSKGQFIKSRNFVCSKLRHYKLYKRGGGGGGGFRRQVWVGLYH